MQIYVLNSDIHTYIHRNEEEPTYQNHSRRWFRDGDTFMKTTKKISRISHKSKITAFLWQKNLHHNKNRGCKGKTAGMTPVNTDKQIKHWQKAQKKKKQRKHDKALWQILVFPLKYCDTSRVSWYTWWVHQPFKGCQV